ncbi:MAG: class I SAM-dependent methyltransferase [Cyanobacteriota bacterium]|nr:class I SAM-dependent methyltransferase [Cyanobacteriota bacterium]
MSIDTQALYNKAAAGWQRDQPVLLSDFTARERVMELLPNVRGLHIWDLGCGEGYMGRRLAAQGAQRVEGFDLSKAMVEAARHQDGDLGEEQGGPLHYSVADLADPTSLPEGKCDGALAVFLFNYLSVAATERLLAHVRKALQPGGFFLFTVPHPAFAFLRGLESPFYLDPAGHSYLSSQDVTFEGRIWRRDGVANPVRSLHKTVQDYFQLLAKSGWERLPQVEELGVNEAHLALDEAFFAPLQGIPLHLLFLLRR